MSKAELPLEYILFQPLANGFRIDVISGLDPQKRPKRVNSNHYVDQETAERFAELLSHNTGFPIVHGDKVVGGIDG